MIDLTTSYLGLQLRTPFVVSANPLCESLVAIRKMEDSGAGAIVLHSLFEEQLTLESENLDRFTNFGTESHPEALDFFPRLQGYNAGPDGYLEHIRKAKEAVAIPIIASLNGVSASGWIEFAREIERAGADALELNIYDIPVNPIIAGTELEKNYRDLVRSVASSIDIPVAVKLHPFFTAIANVAHNMDLAGAKGLVLFNRFYQPDFDIETREIVSHLELSYSYELLLRIHWVAILFGNIRADLAITGGVHTAKDVLKAMMAGAKVAMMASCLLRNGIDYLTKVHTDVSLWMEEHEYASIRQMQGSMSRVACGEPPAFERVNYMRLLSEYTLRLEK